MDKMQTMIENVRGFDTLAKVEGVPSTLMTIGLGKAAHQLVSRYGIKEVVKRSITMSSQINALNRIGKYHDFLKPHAPHLPNNIWCLYQASFLKEASINKVVATDSATSVKNRREHKKGEVVEPTCVAILSFRNQSRVFIGPRLELETMTTSFNFIAPEHIVLEAVYDDMDKAEVTALFWGRTLSAIFSTWTVGDAERYTVSIDSFLKWKSERSENK